MNEEALKLADQLDGLNSCEPVIIKACEDMIRRLVEELDRLDYDLKSLAKRYKALDRTKPLSDDEIKQIFVEESGFDVDTCPIAIMDFARAIEERHGIK